MKLSSIWREAVRNVASGTSRALLFGMMLSVAVVSLLLADVAVTTSLIDQAIRFQTSGGSVSIIVAEDAVDGRACEALNKIQGVRAAGAIRQSGETLVTSVMPSSPIPIWAVTPSFEKVVRVSPETQGAGILLGSESAGILRMAPGSQLAANGILIPIAGVYDSPSDGRRAGYAYAALSPEISDRPFDECWMDAWPPLTSSTELLLTTITPANGPDQTMPSIGQLNATLGTHFDPFAAYMNRATAPAVPVMAALAFVVAVASVRSRRVQLASALHAGVRSRALALMTLIEAGFWAVPAVLCASAVCFVAATKVSSIDRPFVLTSALIFGGVALLSVASGVLLGIASIRERHLFAYFKDR